MAAEDACLSLNVGWAALGQCQEICNMKTETHVVLPGNSMAVLKAGTQELLGWEINFRWL